MLYFGLTFVFCHLQIWFRVFFVIIETKRSIVQIHDCSELSLKEPLDAIKRFTASDIAQAK